MVDQESRKQHEQIDDREHEQPVSSAAIEPLGSVQPLCEQKEKRPANRGGRAIQGASKPQRPG